jgi:hypothetical protein
MKRALLLICSLWAMQNAQAGILGNLFFVEPYLGYKTENTQLTNYANLQTDIKTTTPAFGLKLGIRSAIGVDIAIYGEYVTGQAGITGLNDKNKFHKSSSGGQLSVNSLGFIKMYIGTSFTNTFTVEESNQISEFSLKGSSYDVGLLLKALPYLNIGVQYNLNQYNEISGAAFTNGDKLDTYYSKVDNQDYMVYISSMF